jgi:hypothetical protein
MHSACTSNRSLDGDDDVDVVAGGVAVPAFSNEKRMQTAKFDCEAFDAQENSRANFVSSIDYLLGVSLCFHVR